MNKRETAPVVMPVVALRGLVVFPGVQLHFDVGRDTSVAAFKAAMAGDQKVFLTAQKDMLTDDPGGDELYSIGVVAAVRQILRLPGDDGIRVVIEGLNRAEMTEVSQSKPYLLAKISAKHDVKVRSQNRLKEEALIRQTKDLFDDYSQFVPHISPDFTLSVAALDDAGKLGDLIAGNILLRPEDRQRVLEEFNPQKRLEKLCVILLKECRLLELEDDIGERVQNQIDQNQREYYLREQMKAISIELNDGASPEEETDGLRKKVKKLKLPQESEEKLLRECDRLERASSQSPEGAVIRTYIETCLALPWDKFTKDKLDLTEARRVLDRDHYGMTKVKDRIIEMLAVYRLAPKMNGQIVCLVGPPGVGKTSVAKSVAKAMGRKYVRISLGGIHDEAEIRGHRKTYIGSMPGRIMAAMQSAGTKNPLMLLDEIDKLGRDYKGDPSSALLEVLDAEQNFAFRDHYIELPFSLSNVLFVTTANDKTSIPHPLLDRMEIIELDSYTHEEKFNIARKHLIPKQIKKHGLTASQLKISDEAIRQIIDGYTREAGVRKLERKIAAICRKAAMTVADSGKKLTVNADMLNKLLGPVKYRDDGITFESEVGVVNGLAWTPVGGEMLKVETLVLDGTGRIELTGSLGDVMKESARAAVSYVRSKAIQLGIDITFYKNKDIHIHVPEGAVPKDGPSAGVSIVTSLVSALSGAPVNGTVAMTGEISLTGRVLPIGGLREKTMAAYRAGIKTVIIPVGNEPDLAEVDEKVRERITFMTAKRVDDVLICALDKIAKPIKADEMPPPMAAYGISHGIAPQVT
ncbi:MAG: endopeptidase La [Oscillospiraceae bacterium]|nr:endopeptidase La [Oscillospiraceae bacterium]